MQYLKEVRVTCQIIRSDANPLHLVLVKSLKVLQLDRCMPADTVSMHDMALLAHEIAVLNPRHIFSMNGHIAKHTVTEAS